jgi:hypothetical protein
MNNDAREKLILELEHLLLNKPAMGTLFVTVREMPYMFVITLQDGLISLGYPHTGWIDVVRAHRFAAFCRARGFPVRKERWWKTRMSCAPIGSTAIDAAQTLVECFSSVYRVSGPFGLKFQGFGWQPSNGGSEVEAPKLLP